MSNFATETMLQAVDIVKENAKSVSLICEQVHCSARQAEA